VSDRFWHRGAIYVIPTTLAQIPASYIITQRRVVTLSGAVKVYYLAINGETGQIDFAGTDAREVIQSAINALAGGGKIFVKAGEYELSAPISLAGKANIEIEGMGHSTIFRANGNFPALVLNNSVRCSIKKIHIYGSNDVNKTANHGIYITGDIHKTVENIIEDVFIEKCYDGVRIDNADICWLNRVYCWDNKNAGFMLIGDATWRINWINLTDCYSGSNLEYNLLMSYCMGCKIINFVAEGANITKYGIFADYSYLNWFINVDVENCKLTGIVSQRSRTAGGIGNKFMGGWSSGNGANGIYLYDERWASVINFTIGENQEYGILINASERCEAEGNIIYNNGKKSAGTYHGIVISDSSDCTIRGNHCHDTQAAKTQGYGIYELGASDYNLIVENDVRGNLIGGIVKTGVNTVVGLNLE